MKQYPSITNATENTDVYMFRKYDGSNIRVEWTRKKGFCKFGSRKRLIDASDNHLGQAVTLFDSMWNDVLHEILKTKYWRNFQEATFFFEYWAYDSFAGQHSGKYPHCLHLIDVNPYKQGILEPKIFVEEFGSLFSAELLYNGPFNDTVRDTVQSITNDSHPWSNPDQQVTEGVVCKYKEGKNIHMFKVKTNWWKEELKKRYPRDWEGLQ